MSPRFAIVIAFLLGACASAAVTSVASEATPLPADADAKESAAASAPRLVVAAGEAERRRAPNGKGEVFIYARGENAFLARLELDAGGAVPEHRDATEEYLYILEGSGDLVIDGKAYAISPGSAVYMPANALVSFQNGDARLVAVQVFAGPEPAAKYDAWTPAG
ncbi:MAG: cupin domain-containing protein [Myxococcales bacterium]|nr:cupin domain-containing protein [Myxococcales bacterium]MCB9704930.1 cupin domain-containing protein [Myxococcales bacterium]